MMTDRKTKKRVPSPTYNGRTTPPTGSGANGGPGLDEFSVDFVTGRITLGRQLGLGETLTVNFTALQGVNITSAPSGSLGLSEQVLNDRKKVTPQFRDFRFFPADSLTDWAAKTFRSNDNAFKYGAFLTGTDSEKAWLFVGEPDGRVVNGVPQCRPVRPADGRFAVATAQFVASASYGPVHMTAMNLDDPTYGPPLKEVLNGKPIHDALTDIQLGLNLGAAFHKASLKRRGDSTCTSSQCTQGEWQRMWSRAFFYYGAPIYQETTPSAVILGGSAYEPK